MRLLPQGLVDGCPAPRPCSIRGFCNFCGRIMQRVPSDPRWNLCLRRLPGHGDS